MTIMNTARSQPKTPAHECGWGRYSMWALFLTVTLVSALCSVGLYTGLMGAVTLLAIGAACGIVGALAAHPEGRARGDLRISVLLAGIPGGRCLLFAQADSSPRYFMAGGCGCAFFAAIALLGVLMNFIASSLRISAALKAEKPGWAKFLAISWILIAIVALLTDCFVLRALSFRC